MSMNKFDETAERIKKELEVMNKLLEEYIKEFDKKWKTKFVLREKV